MTHTYQAIVIGASAGGLHALTKLLSPLPPDYSIPILVVQHRSKEPRFLLEEVLQAKCTLTIHQIEEKETIQPGFAYIAPPDYHVLIERDFTLSLTSDEAVRYSRPSIDVLFESAAQIYKQHLVGILLSGANQDGTFGMSVIRQYGGFCIAQHPSEAMFPAMPQAAISAGQISQVWTLTQIQSFLVNLHSRHEKRT